MRVNGAPARAALRLKPGDRIEIELPPPRAARLTPEPLPLAIVYEDDDLIVIDKPAGLVVHPGAGVERGTLVHALLHHRPAIAEVGGAGRPGIVHRLDKDTSGLMVAAKSARAYRALVWGSPGASAGVIEGAMGRDPRHRKRMAVVRPGARARGKPARTRWRLVRRYGPVSEVELSLETGRTHQIRVHLAHLGLPVVGDPVYGGRPKKQLSGAVAERSLAGALLDRLSRQALHASELELDHPVTGRRLNFKSPIPPDFALALGALQEFSAGHRG